MRVPGESHASTELARTKVSGTLSDMNNNESKDDDEDLNDDSDYQDNVMTVRTTLRSKKILAPFSS